MTFVPLIPLCLAAALIAGLVPVAMPAFADTPAADVVVRYQEAAPEDLFRIENTSTCLITLHRLTLDLDGSAAGLMFDTEPGGLGASTSQPFRLVDGAARVAAVSAPEDGGRRLTLTFDALRPRESVTFSIDVDDANERGPLGPTLVTGEEITGARAYARWRNPDGTEEDGMAIFGPDARAVINPRSCAVS